MRLNADIDDRLYRALKIAAGAEGRSLSDVVREITLSWLQRKHPDALQMAKATGADCAD